MHRMRTMAFNYLLSRLKHFYQDKVAVRKSPPIDSDTAIAKPKRTPSIQTLKSVEKEQLKEQLDTESSSTDAIISNLRALKRLVSQPKEEKPEIRFSKIQQHLGNPECWETVRQERWPLNVHCPNCHSTHLKRLPQIPPQSSHNHRYQCLDCEAIFNDDTGTPIERNIPPLNIWMQCWYLMGCTESLLYIANKLHVDLATIEKMAQQLRKTFNATHPLTRFIGFTEWHKQSQHLRKQLEENLLKEQHEKLDANVATEPKDTAEFRRQESLRRDPSMHTPVGTKKTR